MDGERCRIVFFLLEPNFVIINTRLTGGMTYIIRLKQQQDWQALEHASNDMKRDLNMLLAAFQKLGLKFAAKDKNDEKTMIMAALKQRGEALRVVSEEMKIDRELCMAAVAQDGKALQWAGE